MVVWRKQVPAGDTGTASKFGGDDMNVHDKYHGGVDVSASLTNPTNIATPTEWESGILSIGNGTNANKITLTSSAQSANYNLNIPILAASADILTTGTAAALASANNFTQIQTITSNNQRILKLYRPASTANNTVGLEFDHMNSSSAQTAYAWLLGKIITNTAGSEVGAIQGGVVKSGTVNTVFNFDKDGILTLGVNQNQVVPTFLLNSGAVTTVSNTVAETDLLNYTLKGNTLGANGCLRVRIGGYILQNDATGRAFQVKIKLGTTTLFDSITQGMAQDAENRPFYMEFTLGNANATNSQTGSGKFSCSLADVTATTGIGDINDDEVQVDSPFGFVGSKDTTADLVLQITMTHAFAATTVQTVVQRKMIEFIPGIPTA